MNLNTLALMTLTSMSLASQAAAQCTLKWQATHYSPMIQAGDQFGRSVSVGTDRVISSAWRSNNNTGGAHIFRFNGRELVFEQSLIPSDAFAGLMCGTDVDIGDADDIAVLSGLGDSTMGSASGAAYVFRRTGSDWSEEAKLVAPDGAPNDLFGSAVAVGSDTIMIGAPRRDIAPYFYDAGVVYVYRDSGDGWTLESTLALPDMDIGDRFGEHIQIHGDRAAIGVPSKDNEAGDNAGAVYVYRDGPQGWELESRILPSDANTGRSFGLSVSLASSRLIVGSTIGDTGTMLGTVHAFTLQSDGVFWAETNRLTAPEPVDFGFFGQNLAMSHGRVMITQRGVLDLHTTVHVYRWGPAGLVLKDTIQQPVASGLIFGNNTVDLGHGFAIIGEALHGANVDSAPSRMDLYMDCDGRGIRSKPIRR